ncbi:MAG: hypothetical protein AB8A49_06550 [Prochlorococcus sp.]|nr:hypothetical protein [Prochlorococcaceae cyanobacterium ETNP2_MAG_10]MDP6196843.1 hypothetical protein [Prochlorococcaceae cyanobacterium ETNP18_MAG_17]MDP6321896.1 hypothetical protein [Prochlorococcaceae cyanobacterium ETNP14_MAG_5]HJO78271.1 hypothetical protein [Prochlorococcaceae cyanobacterium Fu_MAG_134]
MAATQKECVVFLGEGVRCRSTAITPEGIPPLMMPGHRSPSHIAGQITSNK